MKFFFAFLLLMPTLASAYPHVFDKGVYKGFGRTEFSAVKLGEVQVDVVSERIVAIRIATGKEVKESHLDASQLIPLPKKESRELGLQYFAAYRPINSDYPIIVFNHSLPIGFVDKVPALFRVALVRTLGTPAMTIYMSDDHAPLTLYSPMQVAGWRFDNYITKIEKEFGKQGVVPRIAFNGRALSDNTCSYLLDTHGNLTEEK